MYFIIIYRKKNLCTKNNNNWVGIVFVIMRALQRETTINSISVIICSLQSKSANSNVSAISLWLKKQLFKFKIWKAGFWRQEKRHLSKFSVCGILQASGKWLKVCFSIMLHLFSVIGIFIRKKKHGNVNPNNISTHDVILSTLKEHLRRQVSVCPSMNFRFSVDHRGNFSFELQVLCQNC